MCAVKGAVRFEPVYAPGSGHSGVGKAMARSRELDSGTNAGPCADPLPCVRLRRYVRFEWDSPKLVA